MYGWVGPWVEEILSSSAIVEQRQRDTLITMSDSAADVRAKFLRAIGFNEPHKRMDELIHHMMCHGSNLTCIDTFCLTNTRHGLILWSTVKLLQHFLAVTILDGIIEFFSPVGNCTGTARDEINEFIDGLFERSFISDKGWVSFKLVCVLGGCADAICDSADSAADDLFDDY